jgi:hypothetical protein
MNRSKITLIAASAVFLILVAVAGVLAGKQSAAAEKARKGRDREFKNLEAVFKDDIFPSETNVVVLGENVKRLTETRDTIEKSLTAMNVPLLTNISASVFMQKLQDIVVSKAKAAPLVEGKRSVLPDFAFGFERYVGPSSRMPRENEVPRLVQQLGIIISLIDEMYAANVMHIDSIGREVFEEGDEEQPPEEEEESGGRGRGRGRGRRGSRGGGESGVSGQALLAPIVTELYEGQHFVLRFSARQDAVIDLLNRIARLRYFAVVTDVRMSKLVPDVRPPIAPNEKEEGGRSTRRGGAAKNEDVTQDAEAMPLLSDLPPAQRLMSGPDVDPPLAVTIELDIFNFAREER